MMEALWVHQQHNVVDVALLKRMLGSPEFRARAAATRVLCYWRDRVPDALELLKTLAADPYPRVRLEAVRAASFFTVPEAIEVALISAEKPTDEYLEYTRNETMKALEPYWKKAVAAGRTIAFTSEAGARFFLRNVGTDELMKMKRTRAVDLELLFRKGVRDEDRAAALADLAKLEGKGELRVLLDAIRGQDAQKDAQDESVVFDLARLLTGRTPAELAAVRDDLEQIATGSNLPVTRQLGFVALIAADGNVDRAWALGTKTVPALLDLLGAMPIIRDPGLRAALYPKVEPLLHGLPRTLSTRDQMEELRALRPGRAARARGTCRWPRSRSTARGGTSPAGGRASQKNTANEGDAGRAIDGRSAGRYGDGAATQTEDTRNPYWEVDLGSEMPIDSVVDLQPHRRRPRQEARRLHALGARREEEPDLPQGVAAGPRAEGGLRARRRRGRRRRDIVRRAAMNALTHVRGQEQPTFRRWRGSSATASTATPRSRRCSASRPATGRGTRPRPCWRA